MYHCLNNQVENTTFRIFSPVVLFHDATAAEYSSDNQLIRLKKQKVHAMLKTNVEFWNNVIQTSRQQQQQAPLSPLSVASSSSSSLQSFYQTQAAASRSPTHQDEDDDDDDESEEDDEEIDELDEDDSMDEQMHTKHNKKKSIIHKPVITTTTTSNNGRKRRGNLPKNVTAILKQWLVDHCRHPYPTEEEKRGLRLKTNLTLNQISNWFINARRRILPLILATPVYRQQQRPENNSSSRASYKKKMRRKRGWMASSDKTLCPQSSEML